ncbi:NAD(+) diphosphatase [Actinokineospora fastidiosa]|uniref:NAD(+) diphosphatase n=1 Tax=Actinokineospora fastidiosa TaxID=1816 RepID=A0A918LD29_9PSEU|nr:NAD(+) diphosphatase [Actinokineospora fastidiosa]GGS31809.1 NADH pyrophosphatase [Actinokineospora fastidiosa]
MPYTGLALDRAGNRRADDGWLAAAREDPAARALVFWRDRCAVADGLPLTVPVTPDAVFLGVDHAPLFAVDVADEPEETTDIRALYLRLSTEDSTRLAYARGLLHWHRTHRFCGACGQEAEPRRGGHLRVCAGCARELYPRIEPAVIALVEHGDRCLLARHRGGAGFAAVAGFVEIGESLEDAVRREVAEETGVAVADVGYLASQAWPFPAGLMVGFRARAASDHIEVDGEEIAEARWFTRAEVRAMRSRPDSIEAFLIADWLGA